jgi:putative membrane protein
MITNRHALAVLLGVGSILTAQAQAPAPGTATTPSPNAASSAHQRSTTGQDLGEARAADDSNPSAASSSHQRSVANAEGTGEKMAANGGGLDPGSFVKKAAQGGMTEVALSKAAATQSQDAKIRKFASRMVADHTRASEELASVAKGKGLTVPASLDAEHQAVVQRISSKSGSEFDSAYSKQMMSDHEKTVALFEGATKSNDPEVAAFAKKTLPTLKEHKHMAGELPGAMRAASSDDPAPRRN